MRNKRDRSKNRTSKSVDGTLDFAISLLASVAVILGLLLYDGQISLNYFSKLFL